MVLSMFLQLASIIYAGYKTHVAYASLGNGPDNVNPVKAWLAYWVAWSCVLATDTIIGTWVPLLGYIKFGASSYIMYKIYRGEFVELYDRYWLELRSRWVETRMFKSVVKQDGLAGVDKSYIQGKVADVLEAALEVISPQDDTPSRSDNGQKKTK